jgi:AraC-like DNA-binding protein
MTIAHPTLRWDEVFGRYGRVTVQRHRLCRDREVHAHDFMELAVALEGSARHESAHGNSPMRPGEAILLRPGTWHAYRDCEGLEVVNLCFPSSFARSEWRDLLDERVRRLLRPGCGLIATRLDEGVVHALSVLERLDRRTTGSLGLLVWTLDQFAEAAKTPFPEMHPAVERALAALEDRPDRAWTTAALAREAALDKAYLSRLFARQVGSPPMAYLGVLRAERAALLLRRSDLSCAEIGEAVGYASPERFSKRFRARYGLSPSSYREAGRRECHESTTILGGAH